jgi:cation:H+ antiporter
VGGGIVLARAGDEIAARTGLGGLFVGMLLLAGATSLPEIATDVSASLAGAPALAVGDLFGSSMANMAILATIDLLHRGGVWTSVSLGHARVAALAIALTTIAVLAVVQPPGVAVGWVGIETLVIVVAYVAAARWMRRPSGRGRRGHEAIGEIVSPTHWATRDRPMRPVAVAWRQFAVAAAVVLVSAPLLALSAQAIAVETGVGEGFIGALLLAGSTSLPELVASVAAVRIGSYDLAVGNLFGSNAFNMVALLAADAAWLDGPILAAVGPAASVAGIGAILLMALALAAVVHGERTRVTRLEPDAVLLLGLWVVLLGFVFRASGSVG